MVPRLKEEYKERVVGAMTEEFSYRNLMEVPKLQKIVISRGVGAAVADKKMVEHAIEELTLISGQKAVATLSKKDVSNFKLRKGMPIGARVTLRGDRMYEFLDRLINVALPRVRDFRGLNRKSFDGNGNYSLGVKEQIIFPEIDYDKVDKLRGLDISITTSAKNDEQGLALLKEFNFPIKDAPKNTATEETEEIVSETADAEPEVEAEEVHDTTVDVKNEADVKEAAEPVDVKPESEEVSESKNKETEIEEKE